MYDIIIKSYPLCMFLCLYLTALNLNLNLTFSHRRFTHSIVRHAILFQFKRIFFSRSFFFAHLFRSSHFEIVWFWLFALRLFFFIKRVECGYKFTSMYMFVCALSVTFFVMFLLLFFSHSIFYCVSVTLALVWIDFFMQSIRSDWLVYKCCLVQHVRKLPKV